MIYSLQFTIWNHCQLFPYLCSTLTQPTMSLLRVILAIIFPPLSVIDKGCGSVLIVFLLTLAGWIPGVIAALIIMNKVN
jgi:uncharacterized membrane protein YqaE (UPF0057 family)